jgi:phage-related protein
MIEIVFYKTQTGKCSVEDLLDSLSDKQVQKVLWVLRLIKDLAVVPKEYLKKLASTQDIWEVRVKVANNIFRILGFFDEKQILVLTNGFAKKSRKTPRKEITLAEQRKKDYMERK